MNSSQTTQKVAQTEELEDGNGPMPRQIPYIIANEGCERFSFYGMRNILTPFLISTLLLFLPDRKSVV